MEHTDMEPTHQITVTYKVAVPHELADVMDQVETDVEEWVSETQGISTYDADDESHEVTLTHVSTEWRSL